MTSGRFQLNGDSDCTAANTTATTTTSSVTTATNTSSTCTSDSGTAEHVRKFVFTGISNGGALPRQRISGSNGSATVVETLEIRIPELLQGGYSFYTWPCAPILAWFLWERRHALTDKRILEIGSGTGLPGILSAKCGAQVILSDNCILPKSLSHIRRSCVENNLIPGRDIQVIGLSWGLLLNSVFNIGTLDLIIGADCFYDPSVFEDIIVTVAFLLDRNPNCKFIFTYQERSADWSIEALLKKWKLCALQVNIDDIGKSSGVDLYELMGGHTIHLIEVTKEHPNN